MSTFLMPERSLLAADCVRASIYDVRQWLRGHWALLFSHPEDFQSEAEAAMPVLRPAFRSRRVKPLAAAFDTYVRSAGWVEDIYHDDSLVFLPESDEGIVLDVAERELRAELSALLSPFVVVLDGDLRRRATLTYRPSTRRTLSDILRVVDVLQTSIDERSVDTWEFAACA